MPSPAALAKYFMAIMVVPFNQEPVKTPLNEGNGNTPSHYASRDTPLHYASRDTPLHYASRDTPLHYASRNTHQEALNTPLCEGNRDTPLTRDSPHIAGNSGIYMCVDSGFSGYCRYFSNPFGQCTNLDGDLAHKVSSAGPDKGNWCTLYAGWGCTGQEYQLHWPGESRLGDRGYGDKAVAYNCAAE